jgi:hypothetical protein
VVSAQVDGGTTAASPSAAAPKQSILSALQEERSKKRSRDEVRLATLPSRDPRLGVFTAAQSLIVCVNDSQIGDTFKEMLLPQELQQLRQKQRRHIRSAEKRRESSSASASTDKRHKSSHSSKSVASIGITPTIGGVGAPSVRRAISLDVSRRPAGIRTLPTRRSLPSTSSFASPPGVSLAAQSRLSHSLLATTPRLGSPPLLQAHAGRAAGNLGRLSRSTTTPSTAATAASLTRQVSAGCGAVVMRTPDRPRRQPARTALASSSLSSARVLVAASPPLQRPRSGAQQQLRQQNPRAPPPPLFQ